MSEIIQSFAKPTVMPSSDAIASPSPHGILALSLINQGVYRIYVTDFPEKKEGDIEFWEGNDLDLTHSDYFNNARQPMIRHDGQGIIFNAVSSDEPSGNFYKMGVFNDGPGCEFLRNPDAQWPTWSPHGDEILISKVNENADKSILYRLSSGFVTYLRDNTCNSKPYQLSFKNDLSKPITGEHILWSDRGQVIFRGCATWEDNGFNRCGIWAADLDSLSPRLIIEGASEHLYPMDVGRNWLVYMSDENEDWDIYLYSFESKEISDISDNFFQDGLPSLSPDEKYVAYISNEGADGSWLGRDNWALWVVTIGDGKKHPWGRLLFQYGDVIDENSWTGDRMSWGRE